MPERGKSSTGWTNLWLQGAYPFDLEAILSALSPDFPVGDPIVIKADQNTDDWNVIHNRLIDSIKELFNNIDNFDSRIAVFALAPVSACLGLGFYLTSRPRVRLYQYHRHEESWNWSVESSSLENAIQIDGLPIQVDYNTKVVAFCFSLSASIATNDIHDSVDKIDSVINLSIGRPHTGWLSNASQLKELAKKTREVFEESLYLFPSAESWHIFYAGPAPGGVVVGQQINPTMCPRVQFYEYTRNKTPVYQPSFTVGD